METTSQATGASTPFFTLSPFQISRQQSLENIPRYLFRISDDKSPGTTNICKVASAAAAEADSSGTLPDIFTQDRKEAANLLNAHLRWKCKAKAEDRPRCNLVSWTSSLLVALQYGFYRHQYWQHVNKAQGTLDMVRLLVVDTKKLGSGVFCRDVQVIDAYRPWEEAPGTRNLNHLWDMRMVRRYYFGEYLSQGRITLGPETAHQITLAELIQGGLFSICPGLSDRAFWRQWANRVVELRDQYRVPARQLNGGHLKNTSTVAATFGGFAPPMTIFLLGISPFGVRDCGRLLHECLKISEVHGIQSDELGPDLWRMPELDRCYQLLIDLEATKAFHQRTAQTLELGATDEGDGGLSRDLENLRLGGSKLYA